MPQFLVDLWLDGYDNEQDMEEACVEFIEQELTMASSSVKIKQIKEHNQCICEGNWRHLINEYEHLFKRKFEREGKIYTFIGILHAEDDYYYALIDLEGKLRLTTCVVHLEQVGYKLINLINKERIN